MANRIVIDGNAFYEVDEECMKKKQQWMEENGRQKGKESSSRQNQNGKNRTS